jgi:hypothetical protein
MRKLIVFSLFAISALIAAGPTWAAPPGFGSSDQAVYISDTKIDSLVSAMTQLTAALTSSNVAVSGAGAGVGGSVGLATQTGAGARTSTGASLTEGTTKGAVSAQYGAVGVREDVNETEGMASSNMTNNSIVNALSTRLLQQSVAEQEARIRQQEELHQQQMRFAEDNHAITLRTISEGQSHTTDRQSQDVRHADLATYADWYGKPPTGEQAGPLSQ